MDIGVWDPYYIQQYFTLIPTYMEALTGLDWTLDPTIFANNTNWIPTNYVKGLLNGKLGIPEPNHLCCPSPSGHTLAKSTAGKWPGIYG